MANIIEELQLLKQVSQEQTAASNALSQDVAGIIGEIHSELDAKKAEVDKYLLAQATKLIKDPSTFLLLGRRGIQTSIQFHGLFGLDNFTAPTYCMLSVVQDYFNNTIGGTTLKTYGTLNFTVCTVTLDGVQYLALRNDGEINRRWILNGHFRSAMEFLGVSTVDSVDEEHTLTSLV
ncbi:hypothetical protein [Vibrio sp. MEBiC08052]|uniref:hypothetical protein n=1 Tax=Vibrio sp. MEBiC08052 TaxID=1761910 RepID=UPI0007406546|nr:hypothetical protein [Vibrio sp. MEBiC08052]KUI98985.1 hypothetical protein VRK_17590 [Vibrio sp. MEBiC08052]